MPRVRSVRVLLLLAFLIGANGGGPASLGPRPACAAEVDRVRDGLAAFEGLEYERAIVLLEAALNESVTRDERVVALRTIAFATFALGREADCRSAFERLLRVDPAHQLDRRQAPRLRVLLEETRKTLATRPEPPRPASPSASLPTMALSIEPKKGKEGLPITVRLVDPAHDAPILSVYYRGTSSAERRVFSSVEARRDPAGVYQLTIPGSDVRPPAIEFYALTLDGAGTPTARVGSLGEPLRIEVAPTPKPLYKRAWFWGTLGGVAAAGVLAAVLAVTLAPTPPASVTIQPH